jgi:hypothetical protein
VLAGERRSANRTSWASRTGEQEGGVVAALGAVAEPAMPSRQATPAQPPPLASGAANRANPLLGTKEHEVVCLKAADLSPSELVTGEGW